MNKPLSQYDVTLDTSESDVTPRSPLAKIALIEGDTARLSGETETLLRSRLRASALLICLGFAIFLLRSMIVADFAQPGFAPLFAFHALVVVVLGVLGGGLCRKCRQSLTKLRVQELLIFGLPAAFFLAMQYTEAQTGRRGVYAEGPAALWQILIFTYAMFIPNTWQRAAVVMSAMAAAPLLLLIALWIRSGELPHGMTFDNFTTVAMLLALATLASTVGVFTIGRLRSEAFEARQLGQYRLRHLIGSGGMGEVYLAEHQLMKRPCAIKIIRPGKATDPQALARFEREVRATARLSHWNTIEIFDYGRTEDGTFYYVMEYLPGLSLADLVERHGPLLPERVIYLLEQTCAALGEAHTLGLVHRDIKPGNIFAAQRGGFYDVAKLLDFGLAKPVMQSQHIQLTQEGSITGSPLFMSPEQATGDGEPDARSDIYSLGAVAYFLLTGQPPFNDDKPLKVLIAHAHHQAPAPSQLRPDLPADLDEVVMRCLSKDPRERYQDTDELIAALSDCECAGRWTRKHAADWWRAIKHDQRTPAEAEAV